LNTQALKAVITFRTSTGEINKALRRRGSWQLAVGATAVLSFSHKHVMTVKTGAQTTQVHKHNTETNTCLFFVYQSQGQYQKVNEREQKCIFLEEHIDNLNSSCPGCRIKPGNGTEMVQPRLLSFAGTAAATALQSLLLCLEVSKSNKLPYNSTYEHKFRALKYGRTLVYVLLAACQVRRSRRCRDDIGTFVSAAGSLNLK
jgi:hypothetical protein